MDVPLTQAPTMYGDGLLGDSAITATIIGGTISLGAATASSLGQVLMKVALPKKEADEAVSHVHHIRRGPAPEEEEQKTSGPLFPPPPPTLKYTSPSSPPLVTHSTLAVP